MKSINRERLKKIEGKLNLHGKKKLAKILYIGKQKNFDTSQLEADIIFMRPYNDRCQLPKNAKYPESFKDGPVISWSLI